MPKRELTKTEKGVLGFLGAIATIFGIRYFMRAEIPPPPPGMANLHGKVTDGQTGQAIQGIEVSFNGRFGTTQANGRYLIENIIPGGYEITFYDPLGRYEPATF
jgi:hypothetical protein